MGTCYVENWIQIRLYLFFYQTAHTHTYPSAVIACVLMKQSDSFRQWLTLRLLLAYSSVFLLFWLKLTTTASPRFKIQLYKTNLLLQ